MAARAVIFGVSGRELTPVEAAFFREVEPWGFILFARNIETPDQVRRLTSGLRDIAGRDVPILIDQEGGRVQRMGPPHWQAWPPMRSLCEKAGEELALLDAIRERYLAIAAELRDVGIDVNCVPVLDVPQPDAHPIIGDRALGWTPSDIAIRGREAAAALLEGDVLPVIKHLPGHGRALADSHEDLPRVSVAMSELRATDFLPFRAMRDAPLGMTAHIVYDAIDPDACATLSSTAIRLIREEIGFDGLLMTDDLSMKALSGSMAARTTAALEAGCDVILHCNGMLEEMREIAANVPELTGLGAIRAARALSQRRVPGGSEVGLLREVAHG